MMTGGICSTTTKCNCFVFFYYCYERETIKMKFYHNTDPITIYFLLVLLWMSLFINGSEQENNIIIQVLDNDILQKTQQEVQQCPGLNFVFGF
jgi:hypothetical protein